MWYITRAHVLAHVIASIFEDDCQVLQRGKLCHFIDWAQYNRSVSSDIAACIELRFDNSFVDNVGHNQRPDHQDGQECCSKCLHTKDSSDCVGRERQSEH
jgi:hypothetical protein